MDDDPYAPCGEPNPDDPSDLCIQKGKHPSHLTAKRARWDNKDFIAPVNRTDARKNIRDLANQVTRHLNGKPVVRRDDPESAHIAAERIEPRRGTRKHLVLVFLRGANGEWVDGVDIATADVGGSEGTRRLRELRDEGWPIEQRPHPTSATAWQYRLVQEKS